MWEKLKGSFDSELWYMAFVLVLVAAASFGLGRLSITPVSVPTVQTAATIVPSVHIQSGTATNLPSLPADISHQVDHLAGAQVVIASRNGSKYHLETCPGAKQITAANRITFNSRAAAEAAGYTPAANCPGLK